MQTTALRLETYQLLRKTLAYCNAFEAFAEEDCGLEDHSKSNSQTLPVKSTCLQLLQLISEISREDDLSKTFRCPSRGENKPTTRRLQTAFARAVKYGLLTELPVFPFIPLQPWNELEDRLSDKSTDFRYLYTASFHFAACFWSFAVRTASVDPVLCSAITCIPIKAAEALGSATYVNLVNFIGNYPQMFSFKFSEKVLLNMLDNSEENIVTGGGGTHPNFLTA